jgi:hypothetical protein
MAVSIKGALDALLGQLIASPDLDQDAYGEQLVTLFSRATALSPPEAQTANQQGAEHDPEPTCSDDRPSR